jgi:hypothetical protein
MRPPAILPLVCLLTTVCTPLPAGTGANEPSAPPTAGFSLNPPHVLDAYLRQLHGDTSVLTVRYAPDPRLAPRLLVQPDSERVTLRDDGQDPDLRAGDLSYAAYIRVSPRAWRGILDRFANVPRGTLIPVFLERQRSGSTALDVLRLPGARDPLTGRVKLVFAGLPDAVRAERSLVITDPAVIHAEAQTWDPCLARERRGGRLYGAWAFPNLMRQVAIAVGTDEKTLVRRWLDTWKTDHVVNGWTVQRREEIASTVWTCAPTCTTAAAMEARGASCSRWSRIRMEVARRFRSR